MAAVLSYLAMALGLLPRLLDIGMNAKSFIERMQRVAAARTVTEEDWADLHAHEDMLRANRPSA